MVLSRYVFLAVAVLLFFSFFIVTCLQDEVEINPVESDVGYCISSSGTRYMTTGAGSATWFLWNRCSKYKVYDVEPNKEIILRITGDSCSSCVCYNPSFGIYEDVEGTWALKKNHNPAGYRGYEEDMYYTPQSFRMKILANRCFYLKVYERPGMLARACAKMCETLGLCH